MVDLTKICVFLSQILINYKNMNNNVAGLWIMSLTYYKDLK